MTNQLNCSYKIPAFGPNQPNVIAWSDWRGGCNGAQAEFDVNRSYNLCKGESTMKANDIDTIYVPPNIEVSAEANCNYPGWPIRFDGNSYVGQQINRKGLYQMDNDGGTKFIYDKHKNGLFIGANDIDMLSFKVLQPWNDYLADCCLGRVKDGRPCDGYTPDKPVCNTYLSKCSVADLKTDSGCQELCKRDPIQCDRMKYEYCTKHPSDEFCSCMNIESNKEYQNFVKLVREKTGQGVRMGCAPFGRCNTGIEFVNAFLPSDLIKDRETPCPSYSNFIDQSVSTIGDNNIVDVKQNATQTVKTSSSKPNIASDLYDGNESSNTTDLYDKSKSVSIYVYLFIFIIIIALCIGCYYLFLDDENNTTYTNY